MLTRRSFLVVSGAVMAAIAVPGIRVFAQGAEPATAFVQNTAARLVAVVNRPNNPPAKVDWVISMGSGGPKIVDVVAEGTSLRLTQRSDYASYITRNGNNVQALIDAMKQQAAQNG